MESYFISLKGTDLYCYESESKKQIKFMHTLVGCHLIVNEEKMEEQNEFINGKMYRRFELKLS